MKTQTLKQTLLVAVLVVGFLTDLLTKNWATENLQSIGRTTVIEGMLDYAYTENRGMVFGFFNDNGQAVVFPMLLALNLITSLAVFAYMWIKRRLPFMHLLPFYIIQAGAIGNIADKLRYGYVVDFIHIYLKDWLDWPYLFNIADALLCVGIGLLMMQSIERPSPKKQGG